MATGSILGASGGSGVEKRIYFINFYYPPLARSRRRYYYARALADTGFRVTVITIANPSGFFNKFIADPESEVNDPDIEVVRLRVPPWWAMGEALFVAGVLPCPQANWGWVLARELRELLIKEPGIVLSLYPPISSHTACLKAAKAVGCPLILDFRDEYYALTIRGAGRLFARRALRIERDLASEADLISVTTETVKNNLVNRHGIKPEKLIVTYNGIGGDLPDVPDRDFAGKLKMIYAGAISGHQAPEILCKAWRLLQKQDPAAADQLRITFYGPENQYARKRLGPLLSAPEVTYGGFLGAREVQAKVAAADLGFFSLADDSYKYATPGKLFEYVGLGKPLIAALPEGIASEIISKHDLGWVTPAGDVEALADSLARAVSDRETLRRLAGNALKARPQLTLKEQVSHLAREIDRRFCSRAPGSR